MATAPPRAQEPLDALQLLVNDVLVQTGKALRASRRDSQGNAPPTHGSLQAKLPDTIKAFHAALDELENDIIRAKSVVLRDLDELQAHKAQAQAPPADQLQPHDVEPQLTSSPMAISLDSSPVTAPIKTEPAGKPVAPFPDMGMGLPEPVAVREDNNVPAPMASAAPGGPQVKMEGDASPGPVGLVPPTEQHSTGGPRNASGVDDTLGMASGLNFTDMEFTLAPTHNEPHPDQLGGHGANSSGPEASFDLASFAPADGADNDSDGNKVNMASLHNVLPGSLARQAVAPSGTPMEHQGKAADTKATATELPDSAFADIFTGDGQADGMDFDFSLGDGGMGGDTFDDLMNDRDNTFDTLEHGDFEATYFGMDKTDT